MDSSSNNNNGRAQPKESSSEQSSSNPNSSPPPPPYPPHMAPPNMMYYPPGPGYPGHGPPPYPYPPQPYAPYPNGYNNYPGAPYGGGTPQTYRAANGGRGFIRGFIMCSCILFTSFFVATLIMAFMLHPQLPVYKVSSLTVTNFNTTTTLTGDWDINITVENPNDRLRGFFSAFRVDVVHKNDALAVSYVPDFQLDKKEEKLMGVKVSSSNGANGVSFQKWDLDELAMEQKIGFIMFEVRMSFATAFKSTSLSTRSAMMLASCEGVKVVFQNNTGTMDNGGKPVNCQLYM